MTFCLKKSIITVVWSFFITSSGAFTPPPPPTTTTSTSTESSFSNSVTSWPLWATSSSSSLSASSNNDIDVFVNDESTSRRSFLLKSSLALAMTSGILQPNTSWAASSGSDTKKSLEDYLYLIVRVREATQQERRLIKSGKFKDVQRANVKLAIKFMIQNYRLGDCVVAASAYLPGGNSMKAIDVGQTAVQNLQTILEYFDTSDVENIKVGSDSMSGKEGLVLKGLEAASQKLDEFLSFFPEETIANVKTKVKEENELNTKEFDPTLGDILNLPPPS